MKNNYKILSYLILLIIIITGYSSAQTPVSIWSSRYNGTGNGQDQAVAACTNPSGNMVFVTGWSNGSSTAADIVTIRYNPATGDTMWVNRYSGTGTSDDRPYAMTADNNAVYITGYSYAPTRDIITLKINAAGVLQWARTYNGPGSGGDYGEAITVDGSGNVYVTGRTDNSGTQKMLVLKYDASGNMVSSWPVIDTGALSNTFDEGHAIKVDGSGNVFITGVSGLAGNIASYDILTIKINSNASIGWAKKYNGNINGEDIAVALVLDNTASNVYVAGYATLYGGNQDFMTIKYNASTGDSLAAASYNGSGGASDLISAMTIDPTNFIYVTGASWGGSSSYDFVTIKYNSNLVQQWLSRSGLAGNDVPSAIAYNSGFIYVAGYGTGTGLDMLTYRLNASNGSEKWHKLENGTAGLDDAAVSVAVIDSFDVFVTGYTNNNGSSQDYYTLRYSEPTGIEPISGQIPTGFELYQNYPNPFNPSTSIKFDIAKSTFARLSVYDVLGREVSVLVNEELKPGTYEVKWNAGAISSGIYFYKLSTSDFTVSKRMILSK